MPNDNIRLLFIGNLLLLVLSGALVTLSFAPFNFWPASLIALVIFALSLKNKTLKSVLLHSFAFGIGLFGAGIHWVYVSIHHFGGASEFFSGFLTLLFASFLALIFIIPFYIYGRWFNHHRLGLLIALPCCWLLSEWMRTWLLTGFPWLFLGYGHLHTWLSGWGPVTGVLGITLIVIFTAGLFAEWINFFTKRQSTHPLRPTNKILITASLFCVSLWLIGAGLKTITWAKPLSTPITIGMVQPNIDQSIKLRFTQETTVAALDQLRELSRDLWVNDWVIWPEAAIPTRLTYQTALPFLEEMNQKAAEYDTALFTGVIYEDENNQKFYNSIVGLGSGYGFYHKRRLVPFGEYVPLENQLRGFIEFFDLPTSFINLGPADQHGFMAKEIPIAPAICYEIAYPDFIASAARESQVLLNVNNLGWFLDSIQSKQFMQMAQMRALETGRYLVYSTNNGPSAIIDNKGKVISQSDAFTAQTFTGVIYPVEDWTPFMIFGSWPLISFMFVLLIFCFLANSLKKINNSSARSKNSH